MSHTTTIAAIAFTDMQALQAAIDELKSNGVKCDLLENAQPRAYYPNQEGMGVAPYVVKVHDASYDVGLYPAAEGQGFEARTDLYGGSVQKVLGAVAGEGETKEQAAIGKLYNTYAVHVSTREATRNGYQVQRVNRPDGSVQLRLTA